MSTIYVVNATDDSDDNSCDLTHCSFREAVNLSNTDGVLSEIHFDIDNGPSGPPPPYTISPGADFPEFLDSLIIDGTTQPGWQKGDIIIDGTSGNDYLNGDRTNSGIGNAGDHHIEVYGLHIKNFPKAGLFIETTCIIGEVGKANIFTTNGDFGIQVDENLLASDVLIQGNDFGIANGVPGTNGTPSYPDGTSIKIDGGSYGVTVLNNHFENEIRGAWGGTNPGLGGHLTSSLYKYNTFKNCEKGIFGDQGHSTIVGNHFEGITDIAVWNWYSLTVDSNYIESCNIGFDITTWGPFYHFSNNNFYDNGLAINYSLDYSEVGNIFTLDQDTFTCNGAALTEGLHPHPNEFPPTVTHTTQDTVHGTANIVGTVQTIEVYLVDESMCLGSSQCQGSIHIGSGTLDASGNFSITVDSLLSAGTRIAVRSQAQFIHEDFGLPYENSSPFRCFIVQPDVCETAKVLVMNPDECATTGAITDMELLTDSGQGTGSTCDISYAGGDAWYKIESPSSQNSLIRINFNNSINAIAEAYIGTCESLAFEKCMELDTVPYAMVLDGYSNNSEIYIRVWDRDTTVVNSGTGALLHLTAHELDSDSTNWEICDLENNLTNLNNPTILSERDANKFIVEFELNATDNE